MSRIYINTDGGSRGNPGPAAIGVVFADDERIFYEFNQCIGEATNNEAEYKAIVTALNILAKSKWLSDCDKNNSEIICRLDSKLVVEQVNGNFKIKEARLAKFAAEIHRLIDLIALPISFVHIPREENKDADRLVNEALDQAGK